MARKLLYSIGVFLLLHGCSSEHESSSVTDVSAIQGIYMVNDIVPLSSSINCSNVLDELKANSKTDVVVYLKKNIVDGEAVWVDYIVPSDVCATNPENVKSGVCESFSESANVRVEGLEDGKFLSGANPKGEDGCEYLTTFSGNTGVVTGVTHDNNACEYKQESATDTYLICSNR